MTKSLVQGLSTIDAIVMEEITIPSDTAGTQIHIRNKRLASMRKFSAEKTVMMMHGATYSSVSLFDVPFGGVSFMDHLAQYGYDVYAVDARGYGGSTRPSEMEQPPENNTPVVRTDVAVRDLASAMDYVLDRHGLDRLSIIAMSWGGTVGAAYTTRNNEKVEKLVLIAPQWLSEGAVAIDSGGALGAYRRVSVREAKQRWLSAAPEDKRDRLIPEGWFEAWAAATLATDTAARGSPPDTMRAPNGAILDIREFWTRGRAIYDPGEIKVPVLLIHAEWDIDVPIDLARTLFPLFTGAPYRRWVEIGEGTHMVILEKNRGQAFDAVRAFLDENYTPATN